MRKFFLTSDTITENLRQPFENLIDRSIMNLNVAYIIDGIDGFPDADYSWIEDEKQMHQSLYNWTMTDFRLRDCTPNALQKLLTYDVIYVRGGATGYLAKIMHSSGFASLLPDFLDKGIVYVGSSAGSMVLSQTHDAASWYIGEPETDALNYPGLDYIPYQIYPHYEDNVLPEIIKHRNPKLVYVLLRNGQAISINGDVTTVCGGEVSVLTATE